MINMVDNNNSILSLPNREVNDRKKKQVTWSPTVNMRIVVPRSEEDNLTCFYNKKDLKVIRKDLRKIVKNFRNGEPTEEERQERRTMCTWGLEHFVDEVYSRQREQRMVEAKRAIFGYFPDGSNSPRPSSVCPTTSSNQNFERYSELSRESQKEASRRACEYLSEVAAEEESGESEAKENETTANDNDNNPQLPLLLLLQLQNQKVTYDNNDVDLVPNHNTLKRMYIKELVDSSHKFFASPVA